MPILMCGQNHKCDVLMDLRGLYSLPKMGELQIIRLKINAVQLISIFYLQVKLDVSIFAPP